MQTDFTSDFRLHCEHIEALWCKLCKQRKDGSCRSARRAFIKSFFSK